MPGGKLLEDLAVSDEGFHLGGEPGAAVVAPADVEGGDAHVVADGDEGVGFGVVEDEGEHAAETFCHGDRGTVFVVEGKDHLRI